jgi:hypothetical protein
MVIFAGFLTGVLTAMALFVVLRRFFDRPPEVTRSARLNVADEPSIVSKSASAQKSETEKASVSA